MNNSNIKKISFLTVMLVLLSVCAMLLTACGKEEPTESISFTYSETEDDVQITGYEGVLSPEVTLTIPATINGKPVTSIAESAFEEKTDITKVFIPASVTEIGAGAFKDCESLTEVNIPNRVLVIAESTFEGCKSLTTISFPQSVTEIGERAFYGCKSLKALTITKNVTVIGEKAFEKCKIATAEIPTWAIRHINTDNLEKLVITGGDRITDSAFAECETLKSVYIPTSVTEIAANAFDGCGAIEELTVSGWALDRFELENLKTLNIVGDAELAKGMLQNSKRLEKLTVPFIGASATATEDTHLGYIFGAENASANPNCIPKSLTAVVITGGEVVGEEAFFGCSSLTSVILPSTVKSIGEGAFKGCEKLASVNIPAKVTSIGSEAFANTQIESAVIPDGVSVVNEKVFYNCSNLKTLTIGRSVETVGAKAFEGCVGLEALYIYDIEKWCTISFNDYNNNPLFNAACLYVNGELIDELVIPESITAIGNNTFFRMSNVKNIVLHDGITSIGDYAFTSCTGLESINIPASVMSIGQSAFANCKSLKEIVIPASVTSIGDYAFNLCASIESVTVNGGANIGAYAFSDCAAITELNISPSVATVGENAFDGCDSIKSANVPLFVAEHISKRILATLVINAGSEISEGAFKESERLASVTLANSISVIGNEAFADCNALRSVGFINEGGVITIGESAFAGCTKLTDVIIPESVTTVAANAFTSCYSLIEIYNLSEIDLGENLAYTYEIYTSLNKESGYVQDGDFLFYVKDGKNYLIGYFGNKSDITLPDGEYEINRYAFADSQVTAITVPEGVSAIGEGAFEGAALNTVTAPIWVLAYVDAETITDLTIIGETVLAADALAAFINVKSLTLPASLITIENGALASLGSIEIIKLEEGNTSFKTVAGSLYSADGSVLYRAVAGEDYFTVPAGVKVISDGAFAGLTNLFSVSFDDELLTKIGAGAFKGCTSLTRIDIYAAVAEIGAEAFEGCESLFNVSVSEENTVFSITDDGKLVETATGTVIWQPSI